MRHGSLFSGIGGFDLAAEWMGWTNVFHCEIEPFPQKLLKHYWPEAELFTDIKTADFSAYANRIDVLSGGFPCQPYSTAGKRLGKEDDRHLWPFMLTAIRTIKPRWVVGENVRGLVSWNGGLVFDEVQVDLEAEGYEVIPFILPACAVNAPHRRDRVWFVAYRNNTRTHNGSGFNGERETKNQRWKEQPQFEPRESSSDGVAKNTNQNGWRGEQREGQPGERRQRNAGTGNHERIQANNAETWDAADTEIIGREQSGGTWKRGAGLADGCSAGDAANTIGIRQQGQGAFRQSGNTKEDRNRQTDWADYDNERWERFPTQSPVCSRNDGLPSQLDGITVSKHRQESIKGYGNAVVPQVVLQIFKAIQAYDTTETN